MGTSLSFDELNVLNAADDPFEATDRDVLFASRRCVRLFNALRARLVGADDDDYTVMLLVWQLYDSLWKAYEELLAACAQDGWDAVAERGLVDSALSTTYLTTAQPLEGYVPKNEWERKRSYLFEGIVAARGQSQSVAKPVDSAKRRWGAMMAQSADDVTVLGMMDAYRSAGVGRVRWVTEHDERVCGVCRPRDGNTYAIDKAPQCPAHFSCRCVLVPVLR